MLLLTVLQGPDRGRRFELPDNEPQMIGRSSESLPLSDQTISRAHAELTPDAGKWLIRDLGSSNGTFVNGTLVGSDARQLKAGDQIRVGGTLMLFGADATQRGVDLRMADRSELSVNIEHTVDASDDSMIMASPDPTHSAQFQLKVIYELTELIGSVTDIQTLLERVMDTIFGYFRADRGFIMLTDAPDAEPRAVVVRHRHAPGVKQPGGKTKPIDVSRTIVRYVMNNAKGVLSSNAMTDQRFARGDSVQAYGIRSVMCVPIKFKDRLYGIIHLDSKVANYTYTDDQLMLLTAIGVQTGLAIARAQLYAQRLQAEKLAVVGQTVASLSHSIKNIIQGLRGGAEVVEIGMRKGNERVLRNGWEIVSRNLERINELVMNMLAYSKQRQPELEMVNLVQLLEENRQLMQKHFDAKHVALLTDYAPDMPPVPLDPGGIHQAVLNLLNNALDAVEPESGVVTLGCMYDARRQAVRIRVSDNGEGMSAETMKRMFEPFHSTKGQAGTGLGLVVTKKVIDEHGGRVDVQSTPGAGTFFVLSLPVNPERGSSSSDTMGAVAGAEPQV